MPLWTGLEFSLPSATLGVLIGLIYGLLAAGLVLVYRSSKIINFAHGEVGAFAAAALGLAVVKWRVPYWVAFPFTLALGAAIGSLTEIAAIRRLKNAPKVMGVVATLGLSQVLFWAGLFVNTQSSARAVFPRPPGFPIFTLAGIRITGDRFAMLLFAPLVVVALAIFLRRSRIGIQMRAAAADADQAALSGLYASRMSNLAWAFAGVLSALTAVLLLPTKGAGGQALGPALLLRALVPAVLAKMNNLPVAFGAGLALGVVEQEMLWNFPSGGEVEAMLFISIVVILLLLSFRQTAASERSSWAAVEAWPPLPERWREVWTIRNLSRIGWAAAAVGAVVLPAFSSNSTALVLTTIASFSLVGLSVGLLTGLGGELSLGQFAFAGIGAAFSFRLAAAGGHFMVAFIGGALVAAIVSVVIGIPALRIRGLMLAVTTLSFGLAATQWMFQQPWMLGQGVRPRPITIWGGELSTGKQYYFFALAFLVVSLWAVRNLWKSGFGRSLIALRDNSYVARSFAIPMVRRRLEAFAVAGFLAGLGGAVYAHSVSVISFETFPPQTSIDIVAMAAIGGIAVLAGPLMGAIYILGLPAVVPLDAAALAATKLGWLMLILYFPGGLAQLMRPARDRLAGWLAGRAGLPSAKDEPATSPGEGGLKAFSAAMAELSKAASDQVASPRDVSPNARPPEGPEPPVLEVVSLSKRFGGITAVDQVTLNVTQGQIVGIIGPNGAGKTTMFDLVSGFTRPDAGRVVFQERDITGKSPESRAKLGLVRSFQDAYLFPTATVTEAALIALERTGPTGILAALAGLPDKQKKMRAAEAVALMGLERYKDTPIGRLSTGTRRIAELTCLICLRPTIMLLDEPSAGIAQREAEALGPLLIKVKEHLGATLVVIEHNIPLVTSICESVIAMEAGKILAQGPPSVVLSHPDVIESYLGSGAYPRTGADESVLPNRP